MTTQGLTIFVLSVLWLVIVGSYYAVRVVVVPVEDDQLWKRVVVGVLYTFVGGVGMTYGALTGVMVNRPISPEGIFILLTIPWLSFCITGPIMIGMQIEKHRIEDWAKRAAHDAYLTRVKMDDSGPTHD